MLAGRGRTWPAPAALLPPEQKCRRDPVSGAVLRRGRSVHAVHLCGVALADLERVQRDNLHLGRIPHPQEPPFGGSVTSAESARRTSIARVASVNVSVSAPELQCNWMADDVAG